MSDEAAESVRCYYCGTDTDTEMPGRLDECANCGKYLHVCRMCAWYDPRETSKQCREDDAEEVHDKQAANFCDYFKPATNAFDAAQLRAHTHAQSELAELFGETAATDQSADSPSEESRLISDAEALFRK